MECVLCLATGSVMVHRSPSGCSAHHRLMGEVAPSAPSPAVVSTGWVLALSVEGDSPCRKQLLRAALVATGHMGSASASPVPVV